MYKRKPPRIKRKPPENICYVTFSNKTIEIISLLSIYYSTNVKSSLVTSEGNYVTPTVVYDLNAPIRSKIFNFINFSGLDVDQFLGNPTILPCNYDKYPFVDKDHGHILTGILRIINVKNNLQRPEVS